MGLLDGLFGGSASGSGGALIQQLLVAALSNQGGAQAPSGQMAGAQASGTQAQGGLGGMVGSLLNNLGGSAGAVPGGGLQGLISAFQQNGMGHIAESWVGSGQNQSVSPTQVESAFGDDKVQAIANHTGMPKQDVLSHLAQMLPGIVDQMTPHGRV